MWYQQGTAWCWWCWLGFVPFLLQLLLHGMGQPRDITLCIRMAHSLCNAVNEKDATVKHEKHKFQLQSDEVQALNQLQTQCRYLDVGGALFHTSAEVLQRQRPHVLSVLTSGDFEPEVDGDGYVFIDRDPRWFVLILHYLREGTPKLPDDPVPRNAFFREAVWYSITSLCDLAHEQPTFAVVGTSRAHTPVPVVAVYHVRRGEWHCQPMLEHWIPRACLCIDDHVYVAVAATVDAFIVTAIKRYNPRTGQWEHVAELPIEITDKSRNVVLHHVNGYLVVTGDQCPQEARPGVCTLQCLDLQTRAWRELPAPSYGVYLNPALLEMCSSCVIDGVWYCFWDYGKSAALPIDSLRESWDDDDMPPHWRILPLRNGWRSGFAVVAWRGKAVVLGGSDRVPGCGSVLELEVYDPEVETWGSLPPLPVAFPVRPLVTVLEGDIVVLGMDSEAQWQCVRYRSGSGVWESTPIKVPISVAHPYDCY